MESGIPAHDHVSRFDPTLHGFVRLKSYQPPGFAVFEYNNHPRVAAGEHDFHRLNIYLSQDGDYVTVWNGLLDDGLVDALFAELNLPPVEYTETLFRGYIDSDEQARIILRALRVDKALPQVLRRDPQYGIVCDQLER